MSTETISFIVFMVTVVGVVLWDMHKDKND